MGKEVVYCFNCGVRLLRADFERGAAFKVGSECTCNDCLPELLALLPPKERAAFQKSQANLDIKSAPRRGTGRVPMADRFSRKTTSTRIRARPVPPEEEEEEETEGHHPRKAKPRSRLPFLLAGAGALLVLLLLGILLLPRKKKAPPGEMESPSTRPVAEEKAIPSKSPEELAKELLQKAREYRSRNPGDYEGQLREFLDIALRYDKTPIGEEARREALEIQRKINEGMTPELEKLLEEIREPRERGEYKKVLDRLDRAKDENPKPAWILQVDKRIDEIKGEVENKFKELKARAEEAKGKGEKEELAKLREQLVRWELARYLEEFDAAFGTSATSEAVRPEKTDPEKSFVSKGPVRNEEGKAYLEKWMAAVAPATNRDYEAALARVERAAKELQEDLWKQEAAEDLQDLKAVQALYRAALKAVAGYGPGTLVSMEVVNLSGSRETIEGVVTLADTDHLEVRREGKKEVSFVCPEDLTAPSLVRAAQGAGHTRGPELRAGALMMLLEGEIEPARKLLVTGIPEKYWEYAKTARERMHRPEGEARREREAKLLFWGAGKEFFQMETMGAAIEKYKMLSRDYIGTSIVQKNIDLITRRSEAGREYFLTARDLKGNGAVKPASHPELKSCWTCQKDVGENPAEARETYVEIEFHALPQTVYLCWVYAGACCEETFTTYLQATEMVGPNPRKASEKIPYDVGGPVAAPLIPKNLKGLKKTHAQHGGEKQAARWEWVAVPLPKYAAGGLKKIRLMVEHKGFSVAAALISSVRKEPPKPEEMAEEFRKAFEEAAQRPRSGGVETGLVGHWKLDEQGGSVARDHSGQGNNGILRGGPKPAPGKIGGALEFDGNDDVVEIPGGPSLQKLQEGSYSVSVWFQPKDKPPGRDKDNKAAYGIVNKPGHHEGLKYTNDKRFMAEHWLVADDPKKAFPTNVGTWNETFEPGQWYHVVYVVDATARTITIYVNGARKGVSKPWEANAKGKDYGTAPWRIGCANPGAKEYAWPAKALIDDVRIYNRALTAQEVQILYGLGQAGMDQ